MRIMRICCGLLAALGLLTVAGVLGIETVLPRLTGTVCLIVRTPSMKPAIEPGDVVLVDPSQAKGVTKGDIITYAPTSGSDETVTHRVLSTEIVGGVDMITTKGDHNPSPDDPIKAEQVRGKVTTTIPWVGLLLADRGKLLALIGLSMLLGIAALLGRSEQAAPPVAPQTRRLQWT